MGVATTVIVFLLTMALLATIIRLVSLALRKAKKAQAEYEEKNPTQYL